MWIMTREVEAKIALQLIRDAIAAGYRVAVDDGETDPLHFSNDAATVLKAMFTVDDEALLMKKDDGSMAWVKLVHGNGPSVISDYSTSLEPLMAGANKIADYYDGDRFDISTVLSEINENA